MAIYENNDSISDENAFIQDVDDDDSETMTRQETEETPVKKSRCSIVWKFLTCWKMENLFNANCVAKDKDGRLAYHHGTSSMREHLKRHHPATLDTCDASNEAKSKQHKIISYLNIMHITFTKMKITECSN